MKFAYYSIEQTKQFAFYQIPKALFSGMFSALSNDERIMYAMMRDRLSLSLKNRWLDDDGHVFIIYTLEDMITDLGASKNTITKVVSNLESFGLIVRKKRGQGLPALIYVMDFARPVEENPDSQNLGIKNPKNGKSRLPGPALQDSQKTGANNTENKETDKNENNNTPAQADSVVVKSVKEIVNEPISDKDALSIARAAGYGGAGGYDKERVKTAYKSAANRDIGNIVGFLLTAIKENYEAPVRKRRTNAAGFDNFESRDTDYDDLFRKVKEKENAYHGKEDRQGTDD